MTKTYCSSLPVNGLPKGITTEAQLWDEIFKKMVYSIHRVDTDTISSPSLSERNPTQKYLI